MLAEQPSNCFLGGSGFDPAHGSAASRTAVEVDLKNVPEQPAPAPPSRRAAVVIAQQLELIASGGWWPALERIVFGLGNHFAAERGMTGEHTEIPQ